MNCECIYYSKGATEENLINLAQGIYNLDEDFYPVSISRIIGDTNVSVHIYGKARKTIIPDGSLVLFAAGKYHNMDSFMLGRRSFYRWFPLNPSSLKFEDIIIFDYKDSKTRDLLSRQKGTMLKSINRGCPVIINGKSISSKWTQTILIQINDFGISESTGYEFMCFETIPYEQYEYLYFGELGGNKILFLIQEKNKDGYRARVLKERSEQEFAFNLLKNNRS